VGPLKPLAFKTPTPDVDRLFENSMANARARYSALVRAVADGTLVLPNTNFDNGRPTRAGDYALADETHAQWLEALSKHEFAGMSPPVRGALTAFYQGNTQRAER
jgi:hypothetical protein